MSAALRDLEMKRGMIRRSKPLARMFRNRVDEIERRMDKDRPLLNAGFADVERRFNRNDALASRYMNASLYLRRRARR